MDINYDVFIPSGPKTKHYENIFAFKIYRDIERRGKSMYIRPARGELTVMFESYTRDVINLVIIM